MPQTTPERQARWPGMDTEAIEHLEAAGFKLNPKTWSWTKPNDYIPTDKDIDAIIYLIEEWDFNCGDYGITN